MVGFGTTKFTRAWEPALLWNQLHFLTRASPNLGERKRLVSSTIILQEMQFGYVPIRGTSFRFLFAEVENDKCFVH